MPWVWPRLYTCFYLESNHGRISRRTLQLHDLSIGDGPTPRLNCTFSQFATTFLTTRGNFSAHEISIPSLLVPCCCQTNEQSSFSGGESWWVFKTSSSIERSLQTPFAFGGMNSMNVKSNGFRTKTTIQHQQRRVFGSAGSSSYINKAQKSVKKD